MTSTEIETFLKSPIGKHSPIDKKRNFGWTEGMTTQFSNGKFTLAGPTEQVRPLMSWIRMLDITKIPPAGTRRGEIPPDFMAILAVAAMMVHDEFDEKMLGAGFYKTLQAEKISAVQLARSLRNHVWEFEKVTVAGASKENAAKSNTLGSTITYEITIPCSDRMNDPLKLSFIEINLGFKKEEKFISLSPWLLEEAKMQSTEPFVKQPENRKESSTKTPDSVPFSIWAQGEWIMDREETMKARAALGITSDEPQGKLLHLRFTSTQFELWNTKEGAPDAANAPYGFHRCPLPEPSTDNPADSLVVNMKPGDSNAKLGFSKDANGMLRGVFFEGQEQYFLVFKQVHPSVAVKTSAERVRADSRMLIEFVSGELKVDDKSCELSELAARLNDAKARGIDLDVAWKIESTTQADTAFTVQVLNLCWKAGVTISPEERQKFEAVGFTIPDAVTRK